MRLTGFAVALTGFLLIKATGVAAFEIEAHRDYPAQGSGAALKVISTADLAAFDPIIKAFQVQYPDISVSYTVTSTTELMQAIHQEEASFDIAISSAMDLQTKLANDGFARRYASPLTPDLPDWAVWRDELFAFTQEPAVVVVSDKFFGNDPLPRTRDALIALLRENPDRFRGRIGTYDVRRSGFGYLMATQDSRNSDAFWRLMEVMGRLDARLYCCSGDMIRDVAEGELALAYNVLGSYAASQQAATGGFRIVALNDFVNVMLRTVLIPTTATNVEDAQRLVDFLLTMEARPELAAHSGLPPVDASVFQSNPALRPIRFGPGLLVFLDQIKRRNFLRNWENSLFQKP